MRRYVWDVIFFVELVKLIVIFKNSRAWKICVGNLNVLAPQFTYTHVVYLYLNVFLPGGNAYNES